jgi:hypothetical protein
MHQVLLPMLTTATKLEIFFQKKTFWRTKVRTVKEINIQ